ncbi:glycosyltransferase family 32 protein [Suillus paluster]|uniref:glycosyltransferase family 32 protein n=1 Tax=Suillus paluster TaxID=48578 RepID=UPI001B86E90F|nr:glycosyltransferase family 32 protein [Suillus paluster]KAG1748291.1 glycosyltransferase family 32 protein [Suillus paluster]
MQCSSHRYHAATKSPTRLMTVTARGGYQMVPVHDRPRLFRCSCVRPQRIFTILKFVLPLVFIICYTIYYLYDPRGHIDLVLYQREWIQREILPLSPLGGCFEPERISPLYNVSEAVYGKKRFEVQAGVTMRMGMDCYEFAGTVRFAEGEWNQEGRYIPPEERAQFHTYWRVDLAPLDERQEYMLKSFFATQDLPRSRLILWSNGDLSLNPIVQKYLELVVDIPELAKGTPMESHRLLNLEDKKAWVDGDLVRLLVIWTYGGAWIDMDMLLTRDLSPLLEHEFVTQWDCYDKIYQAFNGALMHFRKHSPYLSPPRSPSTDWGAILYLRLWRRLLSESIPPFKILPFCLSDPSSIYLPCICIIVGIGPFPRADGWIGCC